MPFNVQGAAELFEGTGVGGRGLKGMQEASTQLAKMGGNRRDILLRLMQDRLAEMDAEGYVQIVGRIKDMIIRGGENVYPREIEEFLYTHPDILEAQVFGIPDEKYGEIVCAWVQQRVGVELSAADIRAYCADQITHFKVPSIVRFVDEFPMTVTGKIQKFKMRDATVAELTADAS